MTTTEWLRSKIGPSPHPEGPESAARPGSDRLGFFTRFLKPSMQVLHAYCGDGSETRSIAAQVPLGEVTGIDQDVANLRAARARTRLVDGSAISFDRCSLTDMPFGPEEFDAVLVTGALAVAESPERALEEVKRVLVPGGLIGVRHTVSSSRVMTGNSPLIARGIARKDAVQRDLGGDPDIGLRQLDLLRQSGFVNLRVTSSVDQRSEDELVAELSASGFIPAGDESTDENEEDGQPVVLTFTTVVETVCWKPF